MGQFQENDVNSSWGHKNLTLDPQILPFKLDTFTIVVIPWKFAKVIVFCNFSTIFS
jgi:hypothetical protein